MPCFRAAFLVPLALALAAARASAQYQFDVIGFRKVQVDDAVQGLSSGWLVLVNTGTVAIPLTEWLKALHYAEISAPVGGFGLEPQSGGPAVLLPGQAIGAFDAPLLALLQQGESFVTAATTRFSLSKPWPAGTTQSVRWTFVLGDRQVSGVTEVEFTSSPVGFGVSAFRVAAVPASATVTSLPSGCAGQLGVRPWPLPGSRIAPSSDLPVLGNACFALDVRVNNQPYLLGISFTPGSTQLFGCKVRLGLSSRLFTIPNPGGIVQRLPLPNNVSLLGRHVYLQAVGVGGVGPTMMTNGLELVLGARP
jgi:hypothetical protein